MKILKRNRRERDTLIFLEGDSKKCVGAKLLPVDNYVYHLLCANIHSFQPYTAPQEARPLRFFVFR